MRVSTFYILRKIAFLAFAICMVSPAALAHDFPPNRDSWPLVSNCFEGELPRAAELPNAKQRTNLAKPPVQTASNAPDTGLSKVARTQIANLTSELEFARSSMLSAISSMQLKSWSQNALATLSKGFDAWSLQQAQLQSQNASASTVSNKPSKNYGEKAAADIFQGDPWLPDGYQPYDFAVRDWRFKPFTYRGLSRLRDREAVMLLARPTTQPEISDSAELASIEQLSHEEVLCQLTAFVADLPSADGLWNKLKSNTQSTLELASAAAISKMSATISAWEPNQQTRPELYAIYEDGEHELLIPAPTAQRWTCEPSIETNVPAAEMDKAKAAKLAGQSLRAVAKQLLAWSDLLIEESEQLASAQTSNQR